MQKKTMVTVGTVGITLHGIHMQATVGINKGNTGNTDNMQWEH